MKITKQSLITALETKERDYGLVPFGEHFASSAPKRMNEIALQAFVRGDVPDPEQTPSLYIIQQMMDRLWKEGWLRFDT